MISSELFVHIHQNPHVGPAVVAEGLLRPLKQKEEGKPQPLKGRTEALIEVTMVVKAVGCKKMTHFSITAVGS
jgi:hypothetical protein